MKMARPKSDNPRNNTLAIKLSDDELRYLLDLSEALGKGKSVVARELLLLLFQLDPEKLKERWDDLKLDFEKI